MKEQLSAYSPDTGNYYNSWDELVEAETNGYVVVGLPTRPGAVPVVVGPYPTQTEARKAQARLRAKWRKEEAQQHGTHKISTYVRHLWKDAR